MSPPNAVSKIKPQFAPAASDTDKPLRISRKIRQAIDLLASGECKTQKAASARVGCNEQYLSRQLQKGNVRVFIAQKIARNIARGSLRASERIVDLVDAQSEHVALDASKHLLAIEGIRPDERGSQVSVNVNVSAGYVVNLSDPRGPVIDATVKPQLTEDRS